jgi:hypothetical protein
MGAPGDRGWTALAVDGRGTVHSLWLDHRGLATADAGPGGHAHAGHEAAASAAERETGYALAQRSGLYYASVSDAPGGPASRELLKGVCYCCKTALAATDDGVLYAAWRHVYPGNIRDIAFARSADGGRRFTPPTRVSEDRWQLDGCPDDGPALTVDRMGTAHVVWPTVIGGAALEGALFHASTRDGRTFTARRRIPTLGGPKPSHPQVVAGPGGRIFVAWDEVVAGRRSAAIREIGPDAAGRASFGDPLILDPGHQAVYPAMAATPRRLVVVWTRPSPDRPSLVVVRRIEVGPDGALQ